MSPLFILRMCHNIYFANDLRNIYGFSSFPFNQDFTSKFKLAQLLSWEIVESLFPWHIKKKIFITPPSLLEYRALKYTPSSTRQNKMP
jgi:hypothetical protein